MCDFNGVQHPKGRAPLPRGRERAEVQETPQGGAHTPPDAQQRIPTNMQVCDLSGVLGNSYALIADGVESVLDIISSLVVWGSLKFSTQPPNEQFPYGYGKVEPLSALVVSVILMAAAIGISVQCVREILTPHHAPAPFTLIVLVLVVITKEIMFRTLHKTGHEIGSGAMQTDAWHHRSDSLTSAAAFIGISIALYAGKGYEAADDWAALFAAGVIAFNGIRLFRSAWTEVLDSACTS